MTDIPARHRVRVRPESSAGPVEHQPRSDEGPVAASVGYARPPEAHRFQSGRSGNPKGRPKGSRNVASVYREVLEMKVKTSINGQSQTISAFKAVIIKQMHKALAGDTRSMEAVIEAQIKYADSQDAKKEARELGDRSLAILARARERMRLELAAELERRP